MRRYAGQNEVRFKVTDKQGEIYRETACYFYENSLMEKSNIQSFGRWCMDYICKLYRPCSLTLEYDERAPTKTKADATAS
jgi:hypothetical protein